MILHGHSVLVTGGTGSFGRAFLAHALAQGVRRLAVLSRDELKQAQLRAQYPDPRLRWFLGDVRDPDRLAWAVRGVDIVVHAAAMKRIDACEADPEEAVRTNVLGTINVATAAIRAGVARAVFLSTDKAPNATTLYGATKLCAERLWIASNVYALGTPTRLAAVRYGNVLGSRGSVLDVFREQQARGEPLTITDERATRFWITLPDAVRLVGLAVDVMRGGEVFIPKAGSASVLELARAVVEPPTYAPGHVLTGLAPSERLHETLIGPDELPYATDHGTHYVLEMAQPSASPLTAPYTSDTNPHRLTVEALREMIAC